MAEKTIVGKDGPDLPLEVHRRWRSPQTFGQEHGKQGATDAKLWQIRLLQMSLLYLVYSAILCILEEHSCFCQLLE